MIDGHDTGSGGDPGAVTRKETSKAVRRRGAVLERAIMQAAAEELVEVG